ncbi:unnamed protein product [Nippostrongylus brasiliensis]|uniref:Transposase n=1 Tax=Nippostrongylus brasiliensis TaxID=27835 RepID=A0A0N4XUA2_NIPBR|nr:unnamed protein product [Nippostrongylus brasiliensis]
MCVAHGFSQLVATGTRGVNTLDLVLRNKQSSVKKCRRKTAYWYQRPFYDGAHTKWFFSSVRIIKGFSEANYDEISAYLRQINWIGSFSALSTVNEMCEMLIAVLKFCIEVYVPCSKKPTSQREWLKYLVSLAKSRELAWRDAVPSRPI